MKYPIKRFTAILFLVAVLILSLSQVPTVYSEELTTEEQAWSFLKDVLLLDTEKYNVTVKSGFENYSIDWGVIPLGGVRYTLESYDSKIRVGFTFENYILTYCKLSVLEGAPLYLQSSSTNVFERADTLLQRYQAYLGTADCQEMRSILATVNEVKNMTTTVNNLRFELTEDTKAVGMRWDYTYNGADYTKLSFTFQKNGEFTFSDTRYLYEIGGTELTISREKAISIARERAKNLPWKATIGNETIEVLNYTVVDEPVDAALYTTCKEPFVLYPYWSVTLYLDQVYPGNVYGFTFEIWADTGEIINGKLNTLLGGGSPDDQTETSASNTQSIDSSKIWPEQITTQTEQPPNALLDQELPGDVTPSGQSVPDNADSQQNTHLIVIAAVIGLAILLVAIAFRKR